MASLRLGWRIASGGLRTFFHHIISVVYKSRSVGKFKSTSGAVATLLGYSRLVPVGLRGCSTLNTNIPPMLGLLYLGTYSKSMIEHLKLTCALGLPTPRAGLSVEMRTNMSSSSKALERLVEIT